VKAANTLPEQPVINEILPSDKTLSVEATKEATQVAKLPEIVEPAPSSQEAAGNGVDKTLGVEATKEPVNVNDSISMLEDIIKTNKDMGRGINQQHLDKLAELKSLRDGDQQIANGVVSDNTVFGHPEATNLHPDKYGNLVPIRVSDTVSVKRFMDRTQSAIDELQTKIGKAQAISDNRIKATGKQKTEAIRYLQSVTHIEDATALDLLRNQTMRELQRVHKEVSKTGTTPKEPGNVSDQSVKVTASPITTGEGAKFQQSALQSPSPAPLPEQSG
jgi:hypothetical protein